MVETGTVVLVVYSLLPMPDDHWYWIYPRLFLRGFAEWMFIIGVYGVMRWGLYKNVSSYFIWVLQRAGHQDPQLDSGTEWAGDALLPDPPAGPRPPGCWSLLGALPQSVAYPEEDQSAVTDISPSLRNIPPGPAAHHPGHTGGLLDHHQGGASQIFLWSPNWTTLQTAWKTIGRIPAPPHNDCFICVGCPAREPSLDSPYLKKLLFLFLYYWKITELVKQAAGDDGKTVVCGCRKIKC